MMLGMTAGNGWVYCGAPALLLLGVSLVPYGKSLLSSVARRRSLAAADGALQLQDRLQTADEFLQASQRTPFMEAALIDAAEHARGATELCVAPTRHARGATFIEQMGPLFAAVILVGAIVCSDGVAVERSGELEEFARSQPTTTNSTNI